MRIISGTAKGRRLAGPKSPLIRPVSDKVKEALFNILGSVENLSVLDLFAGTGSVGLEAVSRGAAKVVLVDSGFEALKIIHQNIVACHLDEAAEVLRGNIPHILKKLAKKEQRFDLVFVDPPYDRGLINPSLSALLEFKLIDAQSLVIIEHSPREIPACKGLSLTDRRKYGQTYVSFFKNSSVSRIV